MSHVFDSLSPDLILSTVEEQGFTPTGALFPLNSYENRVYEIAIDENNPIIAKFYRPDRWSAETISEEHQFVIAAKEIDIPTVAPLALNSPTSTSAFLGKKNDFYFTIYPKFRGREQAEHNSDSLKWLGRTLARLHLLGETYKTKHRRHLTPKSYGTDCIDRIMAIDCIPTPQRTALQTFLPLAISLTEPFFAQNKDFFPIHGDCHHGNILWNLDGPHLIDFDDMVVGPPVQDIWMLFTGSKEDQRAQRESFFEGYRTFRAFDENSLILAEPLRTLRLIHQAAWLADRHDEPAFERAFPYFMQSRYWEEFAQNIREQIATLQDLSNVCIDY